MKEIKAPNKIQRGRQTIFLAGSIEQGTAELWQDKVVRLLEDEDVIILNPRREDWDDSWKQSIDNNQFREQVEWELMGLELADKILMYFDQKTKSPNPVLLDPGRTQRRNIALHPVADIRRPPARQLP